MPVTHLVLSLFALCTPAAAPAAAPPPPLAFVGVRLFDAARDGLSEPCTVVVDDGRVAAIGGADAVEVPEGAVRIDGAGRVLAPGLVEWHAHLPQPNWPPAVAEDTLFLYLAHGVTTVRGMQGAPNQLELRDRVARGELPGPRLIVGSPALGGGGLSSVDEAVELVAGFADAGFELVKVHEGLSPKVHAAIARTARERGLAVGGHVSNHVGVAAALANGQTTVDHLDNLLEWLTPDGDVRNAPLSGLVDAVRWDRVDALAKLLKEHHAGVVPSQALWANLFGGRDADELEREVGDALELVPYGMRASWKPAVEQNEEPFAELGPVFVAARGRLLRELHARGVPVLFGTDSPQVYSVPGASVVRELATYVDAGLTPREALATASTQIAAFTGEPLEYGAIAVGRRADLLLLEGDPARDLAVLARPTGVCAGGRWYDRAALDAGLAAIRARVKGA